MPYKANQKTNFPELSHTKHQPSTWAISGSDKSAECAYIGSSDSLGDSYGGVSDDVNVRMDDPFNDFKSYDAEPKGSAPQSGEGLNASSKPEGEGLEPEKDDFYS